METITIPKEMNLDPFYRYKREKIKVSVVKRFTIIENLDSISHSLNRSNKGLIKFFSTVLGTSNKNNSLKGVFSSKDLENYLEQYIKDFVICKQNTCGNPETILNKNLLLCKACGYCSKIDGKFLKFF